MRYLVLIACIAVFFLPLQSSQSPKPKKQSDLYDQFACDYRQLLADNWMEMSGIDFASDAEQLEWINEHNQAARSAAWEPIHELAAEAAGSGPEFVARFATQLKDGTLGIE
tara:strand:- start:413 stop:745 length:333 start_codon:yes stop_codon:yes gene_type:complete